MKILEIVPTLRPGGGERLVVDLCNELAKTHDITLMTLWDDQLHDYSFYKQSLSTSVHYVNIKAGEKKRLSVMWAFVKFICLIKPDIVHLHMCHMFALLAILLLGKNYVFYLTIHNDVKSTYAQRKHKIIFNFFGKLGILKFITISQTNYDDFSEIYPGLYNHLVYNGRAPLYKTEKFDVVSKEINTLKVSVNTKIFLHIARCSPQKNQKLLIEAFNLFVAGGNDAILIIIGAHFNDRDRGICLQKLACNRIHFLGTRTNIADYIFNADAFCLSSIFEGMPITLIECFNSGVPVISTPVCGIVDVIQDGKNGILSRDYSIESYIDSFNRFLKYEETIRLYCAQIKDKSPFTITNCANEYLKIFS